MSKPDPPAPPDPVATARASTGTNVSTAIANAYLNNVNQVTPQGSLNYNTTGNYSWTDPTTQQTYQIPTFTATQTLSPQQQAIQGQQEATQYNLAGMANAQSGRIASHLSSPMGPNNFNAGAYLDANPIVRQIAAQQGWDPEAAAKQWMSDGLQHPEYGRDVTSGYAPRAGDASRLLNVGTPATSFDDGGPLQMSLNTDYSRDRARVEDALFERLNPQLDRARTGIEQRLADQGIRYGSQAYTSAMDDYNRQANDARLGVTAAGGQEQQLAFNQTLGAGNFANQAQGQQFQQNAALGSFYNSGLAQQMAQAQSGFNASQAARNAYMNEQYALRNQPINEITSLMSGSQVQNPNFVNTPSTQIPTTDMAGLINNNFNQQMGIYGQQQQTYQQLIGGLMGLGAGALKMSDRRVKKDVEKMATVFAATPEGEQRELPIYEYAYKDDPASTRHVGPMAQDVERIDPRAVTEKKGVKHIHPRKVMGSILRAA